MARNTETDPADPTLLHSVLTSARTWAIVLGVVGFVCGFVGPMVFSPDANQGPLLGLFITGPGGALLGAFLGLIVGAVRPPAPIARKALVVMTVALAAVCLYFSTPPPQYYANVVDAEVVGCGTPDTVRDKAMDYWDDQVAKVTWAPPRAGWKQDFDRMVAAYPGVVLDVRVLRESKLYENRKPWNRGTFIAHPWGTGDAPTQYFARFAGGSCESYPSGQRAVYVGTGENAKLWPPEVLSNFLDLQVLDPLPARFRSVVPQ
ncbi:MAG TPA: hypothetical protein VMH26_02305 [Burkholderiales bacterium]|nr:hypothetical protein [Burkholderiales bacterium]